MLFNHYEAEQLMKERVKDALREVEQTRLIRAAKGPGESRGWLWLVSSFLTSLRSIFVARRADEPRQYTSSKAAYSKLSSQPAECC